MFTDILLAGTLVLLGLVAWKLFTKKESEIDPREVARTESQLEQKTREVGELREQLSSVQNEKNELIGKGKEQFVRHKDLESDMKALQQERDQLSKRVSEYEVAEESREREMDERLQKLHRAEKSLEDERQRIRREDEERQQRELEERDRMWNEHEQSVISYLSDLCSKPEFSFSSFENTNLPEGFDGSFKPDFLIDFLGQYVIFDAKVSRSDNFQNYISDQVKKTAKKAKGNSDIYQSIFLVVPTDAISLLKSTVSYEQPFTFYVVSPEALAPILASFKKITSYDLAEQFDPQERENIVSLIAKLDTHINARCTFDVLLAKMGAEVLEDAQKLNPDIVKDVELQKDKIRIPTFKPSEVKRLMGNVEERDQEVDELIAPKATIEKKKVEQARAALLEKEKTS
jgi:hypothetical protein